MYAQWTARTTVVAPGLRAEAGGGHHLPWGWLIATAVLTVVAVGLCVAAQRSADHRFGWLLSASVAAGLAIADFYNVLDAADTPAIPVAALVVFIGILLLAARAVTRPRPRR